MAASAAPLTVAVTGPTGTFGYGRMPRLRADARIGGIAPQPPFLPPAVEWVEVATLPSIMDTSKAKPELDWQPRYTSLEALRDTIVAR
jgi:nucleoside-diphosphate-sugar epimerase